MIKYVKISKSNFFMTTIFSLHNICLESKNINISSRYRILVAYIAKNTFSITLLNKIWKAKKKFSFSEESVQYHCLIESKKYFFIC